MQVARGRRNARPVPWGAEELAARHEVTAIVNANPQLWPILNRMTLTHDDKGLRSGTNWCAVLQIVQAAQRQRVLHTIQTQQELTWQR